MRTFDKLSQVQKNMNQYLFKIKTSNWIRLNYNNNNNMSLSILVDNGEALISFSCTFLSNGSDLTQSKV
ncbi:hypothetical protein BpHYR1_052710 [Brachionus plicatilis]|uniref:Uncharacterized protein n=1 Tax=Brachionus plicatilis TaxID=10195 RepID=A0A3M7SKA1_BRAPC|nr:hypothetical protein BpHYR1_052710 [Brachionus plicatilis]